MSVDVDDMNIVHWLMHTNFNKCSYCNNPSGSLAHHMWADQMSVQNCQTLLDRGWSRGGELFYKPIMDYTCCPQYAIRCDTLTFTPTKSQKKVVKKFNKFLESGRQKTNVNNSNTHKKEEKFTQELTKQQAGPDPTKPQCKKAKLMRMQRKMEKLQKNGSTMNGEPKQNSQKSLEDLLNGNSTNQKHKLTIKLIDVLNPPDNWEDIKQLEGELYKKYQTIIHNDKVSMSGFNEYFINTPLKAVKFTDSDSDIHYGSYHQQYWVDDKLIAVSIIDILPKCLHSLYFFYDPDYRDLTLGTYSSLREIEFVRTLNKLQPSIKYYYMGYYIHSCPKMRYKERLTPSYLLCPKTYEWFPIELCLPKLDLSKYSILNDDPNGCDKDACTDEDIDQMQIIYKKQIIPYVYCRLFVPQFHHFAPTIGKTCAKSIYFVFNQ